MSKTTRRVDLDKALQAGDTSARRATIGLGVTTVNLSTGDLTVVTGETHLHPFLTIDTGDTYTVDAGGRLSVEGTLAVDGTLTVNGTCRVF